MSTEPDGWKMVRQITDAEIDALISRHPDLVQAIHFDLLPAGALVGLVRAAIALVNKKEPSNGN